MSRIKITSRDQSGGITANRINSPDTQQKTVIQYRAEGFIAGVALSILTGIVGNLMYDWLFK